MRYVCLIYPYLILVFLIYNNNTFYLEFAFQNTQGHLTDNEPIQVKNCGGKNNLGTDQTKILGKIGKARGYRQ